MVQEWLQQVVDEVSTWEGISMLPHRFGGSEFTLGSREIGHVHVGGLVDIPFPRKIKAALLAQGRARSHHILPESGWISYTVRRQEDVHGALWLFRLSYVAALRQKRSAEAITADRLRALLAELDLHGELADLLAI